MDLRIAKTEKAIKNAYIELRAKKPPEKITVTELCRLASINKSTFYSHYQDMYALADSLEEEMVEEILRNISNEKEYTEEHPEKFVRELCLAFFSQLSLLKIMFSGKEQSCLGDRLEKGVKECIFRTYPAYREDKEKNIVLSFFIQGGYHAYLNNPEVDLETLVKVIENISGLIRFLNK